ncbi:MAG: Coenzyme F420 hydrogenase/dehydrogenase, beta subunit C-terminal domain [Clostridia bacterium]|nr:Coenzyme F420 hydrogenase/dehydrogenase, beta subunit C-terminal domain [Clostridia bacterium]
MNTGEKMKDYIKIDNLKDCCGCGACVNICPCGAIEMKENEMGFFYPEVDEEKCVGCGQCRKVCVFCEKSVGANGEPLVYAAVTKNKEVLSQSSSGGIFTELAEAVIEKGGAVLGAAWDEDFSLRHICVNDKSNLDKLRGSKYVQSATGDTFKKAEELLKSGQYVCYSGTPCQIAGLKAFLKKGYDNLLTIDLICHGVPSVKMLRDDLAYFAKKKKIDIKDIKFRDKKYGWGVKGSLNGATANVKYNENTSPYYFYFLGGEVYRESCYNCRFPCEGRQGDITLGDYWGIRQELVSKMNGADIENGISCVLVNSDKGKKWLSGIESRLLMCASDRKSVEKRNKQLTGASVPTPEHNRLVKMYKENGYDAFIYGFKKNYKKRAVGFVKSLIPKKIKRKLAQLKG